MYRIPLLVYIFSKNITRDEQLLYLSEDDNWKSIIVHILIIEKWRCGNKPKQQGYSSVKKFHQARNQKPVSARCIVLHLTNFKKDYANIFSRASIHLYILFPILLLSYCPLLIMYWTTNFTYFTSIFTWCLEVWQSPQYLSEITNNFMWYISGLLGFSFYITYISYSVILWIRSRCDCTNPSPHATWP